MKNNKKYIILGLSLVIAFTGSSLAYGMFKDNATQNNTISFETSSLKMNLNLDKSKTKYITYNGKEVVKFPYKLENRDLYEGELIKIELIVSENSPLKGSTINYYSTDSAKEGMIEIVKSKFNFKSGLINPGKYNFKIRASMNCIDGKQRILLENDFTMFVYKGTTSNIEPGRTEVSEGIKTQNESQEIENTSEQETVDSPKEEVEEPQEPINLK